MSANLPEEDLSCPVCCEIFQDPVLLPCSHSFCRSCLKHFWESAIFRSCPVCRRRASKKSPPSNRALKNLCEAFQLGRGQGSASGSNILCWRHGEKLKLFCLVDQEPICVVCQASKMHKGHDCSPTEEAALDCKVEFDSATLFRQTVLHCVVLNNQANRVERQMKDEFLKLHQFLYEEEERRLSALKEEEERRVAAVKNRDDDNVYLLKGYHHSDSFCSCFCSFLTAILEYVFNVCLHLSGPVILDPNTAHPCLTLSDNLTSLRYSTPNQGLPSNPERFHISVLGCTAFSSASHSWEIKVGDNEDWILGLASDSVKRGQEVPARPENGFWTICLRDGQYRAMSSPPTALKVEEKLQRVSVQLNWDRGEVIFSNPLHQEMIYTFKHVFTEKLLPYFYTQSKHPLQILSKPVLMVTMCSSHL
uniref:Uncharacterized protein n=1 Tax=Sinocyclocheilus rhinocerous TaxID=307959 RepID=A0A673L8N9_9TELE